MEEPHTLHSVIPIKFRKNGTRCRGNNPRFVYLKAPVASQLNKLRNQFHLRKKKKLKGAGLKFSSSLGRTIAKLGLGLGLGRTNWVFCFDTAQLYLARDNIVWPKEMGTQINKSNS